MGVTRKTMLKSDEVVLDIMRFGRRQKVIFKVIRESTPVGKVPFLFTEKIIGVTELLKLASQFDLPFSTPAGKVFAPGKKASDYAGL